MKNIPIRAFEYPKYYQRLVPYLKKPQVRDYSMIILSIVTIAFFGYFAIKPTLVTITKLQHEIDEKKTVTKALDQKINALIKARDTYLSFEKDLLLIYNLLPPTPDMPSLIRKLENLALTTDVNIVSLQVSPIVIFDNTPPASPQPVISTPTKSPSEIDEISNESLSQNPSQLVKTTTYTTIPLKLTISGNYAKSIAFLEQLIKLDRVVTLDSISFRLEGVVPEETELSINLQTNFAYFEATK